MERQLNLCLMGKTYKAEKDTMIVSSIHSSVNYCEFKELLVYGNCIIEGAIRVERLVVYGNLEAQCINVKTLEVRGNVEVSNIHVDDMDVKGNFTAKQMKAHYSKIVIRGKVKVETISGEIVSLFVGEET